jgi:hypothetical protein
MKVVLLSFSRLALLKNTKFTYLTFSTFKEKKKCFLYYTMHNYFEVIFIN